ncbi:MAG: hypothetical protein Aureis2KO_07980 [Aureisphaera sp.]
MFIDLFRNRKRGMQKDELCGEWNSDDGSGFMMIMGSWMNIKPDGTGAYKSWSEGDDEIGGYNQIGVFNWERIGQTQIRIQEKGSDIKEDIEYKIKKRNGRIELTSHQPKLNALGIEAFWNFAQIMFKKE